MIKSGNLLILQSGMSGVIGNSVLYALLSEALRYEVIEEIYGTYHGFEGIVMRQFIDLAALSQKKAQLLLSTAGYALMGESEHFQATDAIFEDMIPVLSENNIRFIVVIGDVKSVEYTKKLIAAAEAVQYKVNIMFVPQSNDNEFPMTDHSLGYGSMIKFLNTYLASFLQLLKHEAISIGICEVEGGNSGWIVAGSALLQAVNGKNEHNNEIPCTVCLPEQPFQPAVFLDIIGNKLQHCKSVMIVTHPQLIDEEGNILDVSPSRSAGAYIEHLLQSKLNVVTCLNYCNLHLQPLSHALSKQDQTEAFACAHAVFVQMLEQGESAQAAILVRTEKDINHCYVKFLPLNEVATGVKFFPSDWISEKTMTLNYEMIKYALPLIQGEVPVAFKKGVPQFAQL